VIGPENAPQQNSLLTDNVLLFEERRGDSQQHQSGPVGLRQTARLASSLLHQQLATTLIGGLYRPHQQRRQCDERAARHQVDEDVDRITGGR